MTELPIHVFVDTNIFLHFQAFTEFDWNAALKARKVTLLVPTVVIRELERLKAVGTRVEQKRAADAIRKIGELTADANVAEIKPGLAIEVLVREPDVDYSQHQLRPEISDDHLLAAAIHFSQTNAEARVVVATADIGLRLKARSHELTAFQMPDSARRASEVDPETRKFQEMARELERFRGSVPRVSAAFDHDDIHHIYRVRRPKPLTDAALARLMSLERSKHPLMEDPDAVFKTLKMQPPTLLAALGQPSASEVREYNASLEEYYREYERYLRRRRAVENRERLTILVNLLLRNAGAPAADDIHAFFTFPDGLGLRDAEHLEPVSPQPPEKPRRRWEPSVPNLPHFDFQTRNFENYAPVSDPIFDGQTVEFRVKRVKRGMPVELPTIFVTFPSLEAVRSFGIDYRINVANMAEDVAGELHAQLNVDDDSESE